MRAFLRSFVQRGIPCAIALFGLTTVALAVSPGSIQQGRELFEREWSPRNPSLGNDGLGPLFNAASCVGCHHQGGVGGGGDARFNALTIGIHSLEFTAVAPGVAGQGAKVSLLRSFFPGFVQPDGSVQNSSPLPHHGGSSEFDARRVLLRQGTQAVFSEEGGPIDASEVRVGLGPPVVFTATQGHAKMSLRAGVFQRNTTPLFGAGLLDDIPDGVIAKQAKIQSRHPEVSGRISMLRNGLLGRFGWRANASSLLRFVERACANELSLENKNRPQGVDPMRPNYRNTGVDITEDQIANMTQFISALPRPIQKIPSDSEARERVTRGALVFESVGCAVCHVPQLGKVGGLYSDMLLHDMGPNLYDFDAAEPHVLRQVQTVQPQVVRANTNLSYYGTPQMITTTVSGPMLSQSIPNQFVSQRSANATRDFVPVAESELRFTETTTGINRGRVLRTTREYKPVAGIDRTLKPSNTAQEWRTPPLWGVRDSAPYMHDGRADTLLEAITLHGGESEGSRDRFLNLPLSDRNALIAFMETLVAPPDAPEAKL